MLDAIVGGEAANFNIARGAADPPSMFRVEVGPVAWENVGMKIDFHWRASVSDAIQFKPALYRNALHF